ncbi:DMT family transporter [Azospirillum doebereinerae]|uniref:DMT family transporter n=2 Tax=Azospirillum doebereinerae TaxID=92933 RepID=A0A3S0VDH9_9PROT|nr:DMT family transporter [Azospirillum doebereinerae]
MRPSTAAALFAAASAITFTLSQVSGKFLGAKLPFAELAFWRAAFGPLVLVGLWRAGVELGKPRDPWGYVIRCGLGVVALYAMMYALTSGAPIALVILIFTARVLLFPVAARLMLGERSGARVWAAVAVGFVGVLVSSWPSLPKPELQLGLAAAFAACVLTAGSQTAVRRLTKTNTAGMIVLVYTLASVAATLPVAAFDWVTPPVAGWPWLVALGLFAVLAQWTAAAAFRRAPVGFLAPFDFLGVPTAAAIGYLLFGEVPGVYMLVGGAITLLAAWVVVAAAKPARQESAVPARA